MQINYRRLAVIWVFYLIAAFAMALLFSCNSSPSIRPPRIDFTLIAAHSDSAFYGGLARRTERDTIVYGNVYTDTLYEVLNEYRYKTKTGDTVITKWDAIPKNIKVKDYDNIKK